MAEMKFNEVQKLIAEHGAESTLILREKAGAEGVLRLTVPFLPPIYYLFKPSDAHELMVKHGEIAEKLALAQRVVRSSFGVGILFSNGTLWKRQRKLMQPAFHHAHIRGYGERMLAIAEAHLQHWHDGATLDLAKEMHEMTLKIVVDILFSSDASDKVNEISAAIHDVGAGIAGQTASPLLVMLPDWFPHPVLRQKSRGAKLFKRILQEKIKERRELGEADSPEDLLTKLMYSRDAETGASMDEEQLRGELLTLYVAGHETTAWLLSWALALLAENPDALAKLRQELTVLGGQAPSVDDLEKLPYCKMILQETLRVRPPVWFLQRQAFSPMSINGTSFPKDAILTVFPYANHLDEAIFPDARRFLPERWADDAEKRLPKGAYIPFATGARICIGNGFAMMEAQLLLARIVQGFEFEILDKPMLPKGLTLILGFANSVRMRVKQVT